MSLLTRALKEGSVKVRTSVMTMQGAPGTGKSSFQDLVLGRPPLPVRHSTPHLLEQWQERELLLIQNRAIPAIARMGV